MLGFNTKRGDMGISSMILFLAMIFATTIAAQVLMQTSQNLQSKALQVGKETQRQISTHLSILSINADDGSDSYLNNLYSISKLTAGSDAIKLNSTIISIDTSNQHADLLYKVGPCTNSSSGFFTNSSTGKGFFTVEYIKNSTNHKDGYIQPGEIVKFCTELPEEVSEDKEIKTTIIPKYGLPTTTTILTPTVITYKNTNLYP